MNQPRTEPKGLQEATAHQNVRDVLDQLARGVTSGDGKAVAKLWSVPALVVGADSVMAVSSLDEVAQFFGGAKQQYNERGIVDTRPQVTDEEWIGERIVVVKVRWPYFDRDGREVGAERSDYTLRRDDAGLLKVCCVLMRGVEPGKPEQPRH